jgi:hypothetical protein
MTLKHQDKPNENLEGVFRMHALKEHGLITVHMMAWRGEAGQVILDTLDVLQGKDLHAFFPDLNDTLKGAVWELTSPPKCSMP